jgi:hypothetical protein
MHLAAAHFQNHRVPADEACYTCHTNYAMFERLKQSLADCGISTFTTFERNQLLKISSYTSHTTTGEVCTATGARSFEQVLSTMLIQIRFLL